MMGGQQVIVVAQQSPAPTWMGVIMILYGLITTALAVLNMAEGLQEGIYMVNQLVGVLVALTIGVGGFFTFQRKKMGVWMGLGAVGVAIEAGEVEGGEAARRHGVELRLGLNQQPQQR